MVNRRNVNVRKRRAAGSFLRQFLVGFLLLLFLLLVGAAVWYGTRLESFTIINVEVEGGETINHEEIKKVVERELEGNYYNLIPKRFSSAYPEEKIKAEVKKMEKVKSVVLYRPDGQTVRVTVEEFEPAALWCENKQSYANCIFLDSEGYAFTTAPTLSGTAMMRIVDNVKPTVGLKPFTRELVRDVIYFGRTLRQEFSLPPSSVEKIGPDEVTFDLVGGGQIKVTLRQPVEVSLDNLRVLLASDNFSHLEPGNFEYIDLRFGDKVFVNEVSGDVDTEVSASSTEAVRE